MSLADSIRQTASTVRWASEAVMATDQTILNRPMQATLPGKSGTLARTPKALPLTGYFPTGPAEQGLRRGALARRLCGPCDGVASLRGSSEVSGG